MHENEKMLQIHVLLIRGATFKNVRAIRLHVYEKLQTLNSLLTISMIILAVREYYFV